MSRKAGLGAGARGAMGYTAGISTQQAAKMTVERGGVFTSNKSQAVRLPKAVALPGSVKQVDVVPLGRSRLIAPAGQAWDSWFAGEGVTEDFMESRDQPAGQRRDRL